MFSGIRLCLFVVEAIVNTVKIHTELQNEVAKIIPYTYQLQHEKEEGKGTL